MTYHKCISMLCAAAIAAAVAVPAAADMDRRYLALDPSMRAGGTTLSLSLKQTTAFQEILTPGDRLPWEQNLDVNTFVGASGAMRDHEGILRMYYSVSVPGGGSALAVAFSADGINWQKPSSTFRSEVLNQAPHLVDDPTSNLINFQPHSAMSGGQWYGNAKIFYDPTAPVNQRYKATWQSGNSAYVAMSSDGVNFGASQLAFQHRNEGGVSSFYDTNRNAYVIYGRIRGAASWEQHNNGDAGYDPGRRGAALHYSANWTDSPWTSVGNTVLDPEVIFDYTQGPYRPDFYIPSIAAYHGQYIGLPAVYFRDENRIPPDRPERVEGTGPIYPVLMHSNDGINFTFPDLDPDRGHSPIDLTPHLRINPRADGTNTTDMEVGQMYARPTFLEVGDKLLLYYYTREDTHYESFPGQKTESFVAELRRDGFASLKADEGQVGEWRTVGITVPTEAKGLEINANVDGSLRVEIWQPLPFPGQKLAESLEFTGDKISHLVRWDGLNFEDLVGQNVQFRFFVEDGEIYSFQFSPIPEPATVSLLGLGGLLMLRRRRHTA